MRTDQLFNSNPPAKETDFEAIEKLLRFELPAHFKSFLREVNGGNVQKSLAYFPQEIDNGSVYAEVIRFFGTNDLLHNLKSSLESHFYLNAEQLEDFDPPESLISWYPLLRIASGGADDLFIPLTASSPAVLFLNPNYLGEGYVAKASVDEFLDKVGRVDLDKLWETEEPCETNLEPWSFIRTGNYEAIFSAIKNGFDVDSVAADNESGTNLLMMALRGRRTELVQGLLKANANPNAKDSSGRPAIHYADKFIEGTKLMLVAGAKGEQN